MGRVNTAVLPGAPAYRRPTYAEAISVVERDRSEPGDFFSALRAGANGGGNNEIVMVPNRTLVLVGGRSALKDLLSKFRHVVFRVNWSNPPAPTDPLLCLSVHTIGVPAGVNAGAGVQAAKRVGLKPVVAAVALGKALGSLGLGGLEKSGTVTRVHRGGMPGEEQVGAPTRSEEAGGYVGAAAGAMTYDPYDNKAKKRRMVQLFCVPPNTADPDRDLLIRGVEDRPYRRALGMHVLDLLELQAAMK